LLGGTNIEIDRYDVLLEDMPNLEMLLSSWVIKETELSSKIKGAQSTISEKYEVG
jgi:hypothetical protein